VAHRQGIADCLGAGETIFTFDPSSSASKEMHSLIETVEELL
jgi:hypothetical protein